MVEQVELSRRQFLRVSVAAGGGLLIGLYLPLTDRRAEASAGARFEPNAWIRIDSDDSVTLRVASSEMGQGVYTAIPMLLAEELEVDFERVRVEMAPAGDDYINPLMGQQLTGGSTAVRGYFNALREAGAVARDMLIAAAAKNWGIDASGCRARAGFVMHAASGRQARYGELIATVVSLPIPKTVFLKEPHEFTLLGKPTPRKDTPLKVNGVAVFGQDVRLPGMLTAVVARCPVFGGKLRRYVDRETRKVKGVRHVLAIESGVAVVADDFWAALKGREALSIEWDEGTNAKLSSADIRARFMRALERGGAVARNDGNIERALAGAARRVEAIYEVPYLAHACMEPMNCTAVVKDGRCEVWVPTQAQTSTRHTAARIAGVPREAVKINTTFLGGGFGRRGEQDFVIEAVTLAKRIGTPIKVLWTREDDIQHDFYRPASYNRLVCGLNARGIPSAWRHDIAGPSIFARVSGLKPGKIDRMSVEGAANLPYAIENLRVSYAMENAHVPVGFWRSVGSSQNAYVTECFFDEVAAAARRDPFGLRRELLKEHPRQRAVLELAAHKAGWGKPSPTGRTRGIALAESFGSYVAQVAEVSVVDQQVRVHHVVCAVDCGIVVNPDTVVAQMESGIVYGLTAALKGEITIQNGRVAQSNFHDYPLLRFDEMPAVEVHIVRSTNPPGGVGEPGTPPIAPAVANALFAATGKPVRSLPIRLASG